MSIYIGEMSSGLQFQNGKLVGPNDGFVRILCNDNTREDGSNLGPASYSIATSFFQVERVVPSYKSVDGTFMPINYHAIVKEFLKDSEKEPLVLLLGSGCVPKKGLVLCEEYPVMELVAGARVFERFILDNLARFGKRFG